MKYRLPKKGCDYVLWLNTRRDAVLLPADQVKIKPGKLYAVRLNRPKVGYWLLMMSASAVRRKVKVEGLTHISSKPID